MEMNFDKHIKDSMDNLELPYDSSAWDKMSDRLDQTMPVTPKSTSKWWIAATIATVTVVVTTYLMTSVPSDNSIAKNDTTFEEMTKDKSAVTISSENDSDTHSKSSPLQVVQTTDSKELMNENTVAISTKIDPVKEKEIVEQNKNFMSTDNQKTNNVSKNYIFFPIDNVCLGNAVTIKNTNSNDIVLIQPNGKKTIINAHDNLYLGTSIAGEYELGYMKGGDFISGENFTVYSIPAKAEIEIGEFEYENGLPSIHFKSTNSTSSYEWTVNKKQIFTTKEAEAHLFEKGNYEIKLTTTSNNGCTSTNVEKVMVTENYNLGTPSDLGLDLSSDSRHKTFIPGALKVRNVRFTMSIIDPIDGAIIYQTSDASQPWDGTDSRTGNQVQNTSYVWTVKILNPEQGERADYKGVIIIKL